MRITDVNPNVTTNIPNREVHPHVHTCFLVQALKAPLIILAPCIRYGAGCLFALCKPEEDEDIKGVIIYIYIYKCFVQIALVYYSCKHP